MHSNRCKNKPSVAQAVVFAVRAAAVGRVGADGDGRGCGVARPQAGDADRGLSGRRRRRYGGPPGGGPAGQEVQPALHRGKPFRRQRHDRGDGRRAGPGRRLYLAGVGLLGIDGRAHHQDLPAIRSGEGFRTRRGHQPDDLSAGVEPGVPGQYAAGAGRLRQEESGQGQLRLVWAEHLHAPDGRVSAVADGHEAAACALQGRRRPDSGAARQPDRDLVQFAGRSAQPGPGRPHEGAGRAVAAAPEGNAFVADQRQSGLSRSDRARVERPDGAQGHADPGAR
ncbi:Uncharacterised protein [Bordetella pertussis]|nr:Uncharacterised protein [Bordetella pertussis]CFP56125.1 Uncharacterised protein [Bordetella pertussis]CPK19464.1 Uncharacterised protein [Bordetella pertussis]